MAWTKSGEASSMGYIATVLSQQSSAQAQNDRARHPACRVLRALHAARTRGARMDVGVNFHFGEDTMRYVPLK
jgi:hypothetical protein